MSKTHRRGSKVFRSEKHMFLFDPKLDKIYVGNIIKTYVSSNICFRFDPTLSGFRKTECRVESPIDGLRFGITCE